ncbi:MAG: L-threonylcarbamoyladenylate synthase [Armatimonadota bacterium]
MAITLKIDPDAPQPELIARVVECLRNGGVVAFPTETVYGLAASLGCEAGIRRVWEVKRRPENKPLPVQIAHATQLGSVWSELPHHAMPLIQAFMPGPLTLVYWKHNSIPDFVNAGLPSLGVRIPQHPIALSMISQLGAAIVAPSANISGEAAPVQASDISTALRSQIDIVIDAGACPGGLPSTVLDICCTPARILRAGEIGRDELELYLPIAD